MTETVDKIARLRTWLGELGLPTRLPDALDVDAVVARVVHTMDEITGGSPYGATTIAGGQGERQPSEAELGMARFQGKHVAGIAKKLKA